jgi:Peptidase_C39 like family
MRRLLRAAAAWTVAAGAVPVVLAGPRQAAVSLLDVPYVAQSEALCGGAAAAMVMRFYGAAGVTSATFAGLLDPQAAGIHTSDLVAALRTRGWRVEAGRGDGPSVQAYLAARRPVVALVEERPRAFHYVVIVGWFDGRVIVHDPARAPFRVLREPEFMRRWEQSGFWMLTAMPSASAIDVRPDPPRTDAEGSLEQPAACQGMVDEGVRLAEQGRLEDSRLVLESAIAACPDAPAPWREMAGLHAIAGRWPEAVESARQATARDKEDEHAWRILATGLFLEGDSEGALAAWNAIDEPLIDLVIVQGLDRTRHEVATRVLGLPEDGVLTTDRLRAARRRLADLPSATTTSVTYRPRQGDRADVQATVVERSLLPKGLFGLATIGVRILTDREIALTVASPTGGGELFRASWRWWNPRPRVSLSLSTPSPLGGVWTVGGLDERQAFASPGGTAVSEARQNASFGWSDWTNHGFKWTVGTGVDRFRGSDPALSVSLGGEQRTFGDRLSVSGRTSRWFGDVEAWTAALQSEWRSRTANEGLVWSARAAVEAAADAAPLTLWPGAGSGLERSVVLRAHRVLDHGVVTGETFGRRLVHGGAEWRRWMTVGRAATRVAPAWFVDTGRSMHRLDGRDGRWQIDAGVGVRVAIPGGVLRIDVAKGLSDGSTAVSMGWAR